MPPAIRSAMTKAAQPPAPALDAGEKHEDDDGISFEDFAHLIGRARKRRSHMPASAAGTGKTLTGLTEADRKRIRKSCDAPRGTTRPRWERAPSKSAPCSPSPRPSMRSSRPWAAKTRCRPGSSPRRAATTESRRRFLDPARWSGRPSLRGRRSSPGARTSKLLGARRGWNSAQVC